MKKRLAGLALLCLFGAVAEAGYVRGYTRRDGTYVAPYYRGGGSGGSTYTSPSGVPSGTSIAPAPKITIYPVAFVGKPCGNSQIAQDKVCRIGTAQQKKMGFFNCTEAWENGVQDIKRDNVAFSGRLDRDGDGVACEVSDMYDGETWIYGVEDAYPSNATEFDDEGHLKLSGLPKVDYVSISAISQLAPVSRYGDGKLNIFLVDKSITFMEGSAITSEGWKLEVPPFYSPKTKEVLVPLSFLRLVSCKYEKKGNLVTAKCPDGSVMQTQLAIW